MARRFVSITVCLCLTLLQPAGPALLVAWAQAEQADAYAAALAGIDAVMADLAALQGELDASGYDLDSLAFDLTFEEPEAIAAWVSEHVAVDIYRGSLRGAEGTLLGRAGNMLDRNLLLGALLEAAGYEVRLVRSHIGAAQAAQLLDLVARRGQEPLPDVARLAVNLEPDALGTLVANALTTFAETATIEDVEGSAAVVVEVEAITAALTGAGVELGAQETTSAALLDEAADYYFSEFRLTADEAWRALHPVAVDAAAWQLEALQAFAPAELPAELQHRLRLDLAVERLEAGELVSESQLSGWERPVADLVAAPLVLSNRPQGIEASDMASLSVEEIARAGRLYVPYLDGAPIEGGLAVDTAGLLYTPAEAADTLAGVARGAGGAFGALGGGEAGAASHLVSQTLTLTLLKPDGSTERFERRLFDLLDPGDRAAGALPSELPLLAAAVGLMTQPRLFVASTSLSRSYLLDRVLDRLLATRPYLEALASGVHRNEIGLDPNELALPPSDLDHLLLLDTFDLRSATGSGVSYRPEPTLLLLSDEVVLGDQARALQRTDVINNTRRTLTSAAVPEPRAAMVRGVWETFVEDAALSAAGTSAFATLAGRRDLRVVTSVAELAGFDLSIEARSNLARELEAGFTVLLPEGGAAAWWRVDPATGETLGITEDGRGQAMTEYVITLSDVGLNVYFTLKGLEKCLEEETVGAMLCCALKTHINNVVGLNAGNIGGLAGSIVSLTLTTMIGVFGDELDFAAGMGISCEGFEDVGF